MITPRISVLGYINGSMVIDPTKTVRRYKIIALLKREKRPSVSIFIGRVSKLRTGFKIRKRRAKIVPPHKSIPKSPCIFIPGMRMGIKKSAKVLIKIRRKSVFMRWIHASK